MKTKYFLIIIAAMFFRINSYSQDDIVNVIKNFYENADMNCYIDKAQKRMIENYEFYARWGQWDSMFRSHIPLLKIRLHQNNTVPILNIQFINTENYNYSDNIYNYIVIDSVWTFTFAYIDKRMNVNAFVNYAAPNGSYWDISDKKSPYKKHKKIIKRINKYKPEFILRCSALAGWHGDRFLYIKDDKIYILVAHKGKEKGYELNEFLRSNPIEDIRRNLNFSYIPLIGGEGESMRRTGNAPENEKMICHPSLNVE